MISDSAAENITVSADHIKDLLYGSSFKIFKPKIFFYFFFQLYLFSTAIDLNTHQPNINRWFVFWKKIEQKRKKNM